MAQFLRSSHFSALFILVCWLVTTKPAFASAETTNPPATDITVSGFATTFNALGLNTVYTPDGTFNSSPQWSGTIVGGLSAHIQWSGKRWEIVSTDLANLIAQQNSNFPFSLSAFAYSYGGTSTAPPCTGWFTSLPDFGGTSNVVLSGECVSVSPPVGLSTVTMAGFTGINADFNGTYTWIGTLNGGNI